MKKSTTTKSAKAKNWNYEATVANLETIIDEIESGQLDLAEVFDKFAWAVAALQECEVFLSEKKKQMNLLIETLEDEAEF
ncbi:MULTISPECIES: exodeoxyribonuclease VII small subunit [Planktothricoides]|uniref:Exodeoxyribonuclease 7 small subunit n=2 Tax=Planktothricoides raciborskii TaxID=132608 RepID=A0AAU8JFS4_9CYAN|nr:MULTISPECIES: exodeoxyribonuclease VII small subunit [Planktothricoides]KOR37291.1 exodeoxyribonuclease VII [Planktothricoides sp. SR001]MBD2542365.1 exodeoxyribonuclease VII small subunit [Planktothricoides raciborskii FACHB-1370]MBD2582033.1 exodeoxyribonuclease VII small subunit [Planktothricoides raciborskii FACHB-1261]